MAVWGSTPGSQNWPKFAYVYAHFCRGGRVAAKEVWVVRKQERRQKRETRCKSMSLAWPLCSSRLGWTGTSCGGPGRGKGKAQGTRHKTSDAILAHAQLLQSELPSLLSHEGSPGVLVPVTRALPLLLRPCRDCLRWDGRRRPSSTRARRRGKEAGDPSPAHPQHSLVRRAQGP